MEMLCIVGDTGTKSLSDQIKHKSSSNPQTDILTNDPNMKKSLHFPNIPQNEKSFGFYIEILVSVSYLSAPEWHGTVVVSKPH